ncbi:LacI family DNA-binding transcriptional regulator [Devosia sp. A449]
MQRRSPTMADVARLAGVTAMTVSRALRQEGAVSEATRQRIQAAAETLGYVLDGAAAGLKAGRTGFVAVVIPTLNNSNFAETVQGLTDRLAGSRLQVLLGYTNYQIEEEERVIESLLVRRPEAIVVTGGDHTERARRLLANAGVPVIEMWEIPSAPIGQVVGFSNFDAGRLMVEHLHAAGYRRIAFVGGTAAQDARGIERRRGYEAAVLAAGHDAPRVLAFGEPPITLKQGPQAVQALQARWPDLDAVICVSDLLAFGMLAECQRQGIAVPGQWAIAGFGNYDVSEATMPALTTIDVQARMIGTRVGDAMLEAIAAGGNAEPRILLTDISLVVRQST